MSYIKVHIKNLTLFLSLFVFQLSISAQKSFLEDFPMEYELREIQGVVELPNGNYCLIVKEDDMSMDVSNIESVYLFDQCGNYIERIQFLNTEEYVDLFNITVFEEKILLLGYFEASDYMLMLDPYDLSVIDEKKYSDWDYKNQIVDTEAPGIGHLGVGSDFLNYSFYDDQLERTVDIGVTIEEEDIRWVTFIHATKDFIFYDKSFDETGYHEIGIANYELEDVGTIGGSSVHGNITFGNKIFVNDTTFYTTIVYELDEGLYFRKYILDSVVSEIFIDPLSRIGEGFYYTVDGDQVNVIHFDKSYVTYDLESANIINERQLLPDSISNLRWSTSVIETNDGGKLFTDVHWTNTNNKWQSYIRLIKLNSELELITSAPCTVPTSEIAKDDFEIRIGSNPSNGSFTLYSDVLLSSIELYSADGDRLNAEIVQERNNTFAINTNYKGLTIIIAKTHKGIQVSNKVIIY